MLVMAMATAVHDNRVAVLNPNYPFDHVMQLTSLPALVGGRRQALSAPAPLGPHTYRHQHLSMRLLAAEAVLDVGQAAEDCIRAD